MLIESNFNLIKKLCKDSYILNQFIDFEKKHPQTLYLQYNQEAIFCFWKNKNKIHEGLAFFLDSKHSNDIIVALKDYFSGPLIPYLLNKNRKEIFENLKPQNISLKMHKYVLSKALKPIQHSYQILEGLFSDELMPFYATCFAREFNENAKHWLLDFQQMQKELKKGCFQINIFNEIAASLMYWEMQDFNFIFLLGTHPQFRRKKLAYILIQHFQNKFPSKAIALTTWSETETESFYLNIGFEKKELAHICI